MTVGADLTLFVERELFPRVANQLLNELEAVEYQSPRGEWQHNEPNNPLPEHQDLDGLQWAPANRDEALAKSGWGLRAIYGVQTRFTGGTWRAATPGPADHPGCECVEADITVREYLRIVSQSLTGTSLRVVVKAEGPPINAAGLPPALAGALSRLVRNQIDDDLADGTILRRIWVRLAFG